MTDRTAARCVPAKRAKPSPADSVPRAGTATCASPRHWAPTIKPASPYERERAGGVQRGDDNPRSVAAGPRELWPAEFPGEECGRGRGVGAAGGPDAGAGRKRRRRDRGAVSAGPAATRYGTRGYRRPRQPPARASERRRRGGGPQRHAGTAGTAVGGHGRFPPEQGPRPGGVRLLAQERLRFGGKGERPVQAASGPGHAGGRDKAGGPRGGPTAAGPAGDPRVPGRRAGRGRYRSFPPAEPANPAGAWMPPPPRHGCRPAAKRSEARTSTRRREAGKRSAGSERAI
jgi:hypothetical protein